uniref:Uncharacterized protein n=1 Tax=Setaria viridis TaxID=4556 RepID=A0A4U6UCH0_SETVI|nr:hypothetical protein SEVIR_5G018433v2 [Setaria viridis]
MSKYTKIALKEIVSQMLWVYVFSNCGTSCEIVLNLFELFIL